MVARDNLLGVLVHTEVPKTPQRQQGCWLKKKWRTAIHMMTARIPLIMAKPAKALHTAVHVVCITEKNIV